jgi:23S rRNA pseudouridine1911/1915/1917 synthase
LNREDKTECAAEQANGLSHVSPLELQVDQGGDRLDRWLTEQLPDLSRARIQKLIEQGHVTRNGQACLSKKDSVQAGDRIHLTIPDPIPLGLPAQKMPLEVLYEDDDVLILNKPTGLVVHPAPGHEDGTLVNAILAHCPNLQGVGGVQRPGIVHRLDKDTSGAIAIAKTDPAHHHLQAQFKAKTARRTYLAVVHGVPAADKGTIDEPIGRHPGDRKKMAVISPPATGRSAITHWQVQQRMGNYSLLQFELETGRTHQIRVHCAFIGHPIIGDPVYGSRRSVGVNVPGQALHAWKLRLQHPRTEEWIEAIAPLPPYFQTLVRVLEQRASQ